MTEEHSTFPPNIDESRANPYPHLPDPLLTSGGKKVTTKKMWWKIRRPEIMAGFDTAIYGKLPKDLPRVTWKMTGVSRETKWNVPVIIKTLSGRADLGRDTAPSVHIQLTLTTPARASAPVPVIMEFGFNFPPGFRFPGPPAAQSKEPDWQSQLLEAGLGVCSPGARKHTTRQRRRSHRRHHRTLQQGETPQT